MMTAHTHEELAIAALPVDMQMRMASLVLRGVSFEHTERFWWARNTNGFSVQGTTLLRLLDKLGWTDAQYD